MVRGTRSEREVALEEKMRNRNLLLECEIQEARTTN
jgi:hypothetical protein